ncbi:hypothetical protein [Rhodococcus phage REQ1]|uniref:hypothetical protein n=1 Tax=Rhodococcus phage REQ1 TaxID=1109712 RepID=UPI00023EEBEB|nr:hypothetical protein RoPhREQ1_gp10 [Rhodococcus phage REQ1]AEV52006.1 hypothetical protein [Rhodococcus phage REQ1]
MSPQRLWPYTLVAVAAAGTLAFAGCAALSVGDGGKSTVDTPPFDPFSTSQHTADADTPPMMFDGDTGTLRVPADIAPGTYTATPTGEGFYSVLTCWADHPSCYGETAYITEPTKITVPPDAVGLTIAYIDLRG